MTRKIKEINVKQLKKTILLVMEEVIHEQVKEKNDVREAFWNGAQTSLKLLYKRLEAMNEKNK